MKVVVALDSFKGSCTALEACEAVKMGILQALPECSVACCPISDGGEGLIDSLYPVLREQGFEKRYYEVMGPYQENVSACFLYHAGRCEAVLEMAQCSGLGLNLGHERAGQKATTYGLGQLAAHVASLGCKSIKMGLGGSATNDAGAGFAQALGAKFYDTSGALISAPMCGELLGSVASVDTAALDSALDGVEVFGTCDVTNPLTGPNGATYTFGPQKGISSDSLAALDENMRLFAMLMNAHYSLDVDSIPGTGAAGGMGAALLWFAKGKLERGIELVMRTIGLSEQIANSDLVFVGEGRIDGQSLQGKAPMGVAQLAKSHNVPVIALCGSIGPNCEPLYEHGIDAIFSLCNGPMSLDDAMANATNLLQSSSYNIMRTWALQRH